MQDPPPLKLSIAKSVRNFLRDRAVLTNAFSATADLIKALWAFLRDSAPARLRQRYGDAEYDWDFRVNTTSAAVGWRDRLLGALYSPYQPTEPGLFREMLDDLRRRAKATFAEFTFLDLGSGKGRTLLMASDYPFRSILGVELLPALHRIAQQNLAEYHAESQKCFAVECVCADATSFPLPSGPLLIYLFNPFPEAGLRRVLLNLTRDYAAHPRAIYLLYHNPQLESQLLENSSILKLGGTHQYSIYELTSNRNGQA
jgi:SAM-dependent methyltransferase